MGVFIHRNKCGKDIPEYETNLDGLCCRTIGNMLLNENNTINYEELEKATDDIIKGTSYINSLSLAEEQGRTIGGRRNVEASLITSAIQGTDTKKQTGIREISKIQEGLLKTYAKDNDIWFDGSEFPESEIIGEGSESKIFPSPKKECIRKVINYRRFSKTPLEFLTNRVSLHNYLFPETPYELIGFTETEDFTGKKQFAFVVEQPIVEGDYIDSSKKEFFFIEEAKKKGFEISMENFKPKILNKDYVVSDLHFENILVDNSGVYYFIDTVPSLNPENRSYGDYSILPNPRHKDE